MKYANVSGGVSFAYVLGALMFTTNFYWNLTAYLIVGWIFGNWAGMKDKEQTDKKRGKKSGE